MYEVQYSMPGPGYSTVEVLADRFAVVERQTLFYQGAKLVAAFTDVIYVQEKGNAGSACSRWGCNMRETAKAE